MIDKPIDKKRRLFLKAGAAATVPPALYGCAALSPERYSTSHILPDINPYSSEIETSSGSFDNERARQNIAVAVLPIIYERTILKPHTNLAIQDKKAKDLIGESLPEGAEFTVIRHGNSTAVIVCDPKKARITIAYDGTEEWADKMDNLNSNAFELSGGRKVHTGFYSALERLKDANKPAGSDNPTLFAAVKKQVETYAAQQAGDVEFVATGFSKGGCESLLTLDKLMDEKLPSNLKFGDWQTFGSPAFANAAWQADFEGKCKEHTITGDRVVVCNDPVPRQMTGEIFYQRARYTQSDNVVYLMPNAELSSCKVWVKPEGKGLEEFQKEKAKLVGQPYGHDPDWYAKLLGANSLRVTVEGSKPVRAYVSRVKQPKDVGQNGVTRA